MISLVLILDFIVGGKKKHRKELVAVKRRQRMINRGVDLDQINYVRPSFVCAFKFREHNKFVV